MRIVKIRAGLLLFILIGLTFYLFLSHYPIDLDTNLFKRVVISSTPTYIMLYVSLLIHLSNYLDEKILLLKVSHSEQLEWDVSVEVFWKNLSNEAITLQSITSDWFKTYHFDDELMIEKKSTDSQKIVFNLLDKHINDTSVLVKQKKLDCVFILKKQGHDKPFSMRKNIINPFRGNCR